MSLNTNPAFGPTSNTASHSVARVAEIDPAMTEGRRHVDVALDPLSYGRAVIADEGGGVWLWWEEKSAVEGRLVKTTKLCVPPSLYELTGSAKLRGAVSNANSSFYRVAFGIHPNTILVMSRTTVVVLDAEVGLQHLAEAHTYSYQLSNTPNRSTLLLSLPGSSEVLTALDRTAPLRNGPFTYVCTSKQVLWVDPSGNRCGSPALRWQHDLGGGQDHELGLSVIATPDPHGRHKDTILVHQTSSGRVHGIITLNQAPATLVSEPWSLDLVPQDGGVNTIISVATPQQRSSSTAAITVVAIGNCAISVGSLALVTGGSHSDGANTALLEPTMPDGEAALERLPEVSRDLISVSSNVVTKAQVLHARWAWLG